MPRGKPNASFHERFMKRITINSTPESTCWLWNGTTLANGYGECSPEGKRMYTHRYSYIYHKGAIPEGFDICHSCDVRLCCNPEHLRADTRKSNVDDMRARNPKAFNRKISDADVLVICSKVAEGKTINEVAEEYSVDRHTISKIVNNKTHKHITR
jgi:hypothetical protein